MDKMTVFFSMPFCDVCTEHPRHDFTVTGAVRGYETVSTLSDKKDAPKGVLKI